MLARIISWSVANKLIVLLLTVAAISAGVVAVRRTNLEALPDLSDVQVIVQTDFNEQAPRIVEDQITYPIAAEMLKVPGSRVVRGYSFFGVSFVYIIFADGTDLYWARSRVLEYLSGLQGRLPKGAVARLGPDATGLGWVFQYALEDTTGRLNLADLRGLQDWYLRYQLTAVPGVSEVATLGGYEKQYQVDIDPARLQAYGIPVTRVMSAIQNANNDVGAMVMELSEREYMVRGLGYLRSLTDIENVAVGATASGTPIRVADLAHVSVGPAVRRGIAELDGRGDAVGAIVVMRFGENALSVIERVKAKIASIQGSLPVGVVLRPVYDRSALIERAITNLRGKLLEESIIVALVCIVFLLHAQSAIVAIVTLPVGILMAFIAMRSINVGADIMSLGGIAIAIGAMVDAAIVMIENMHKHLEQAVVAKETSAPVGQKSFSTGVLTTAERWQVVVEASREVGPSLFFSLLIITVSFLPVFALEGQEGRLFKPLAFTKTFAMAASSLLAVTLVPVAMGIFIRGKIYRERANPLNRALIWVYRPLITFALRHRAGLIGAAVVALALTWIPVSRIGSEFMPPVEEGTVLFMPQTLPGVSVARAREILIGQDQILGRIPEVEHVWGKAGRANTATDPAGLDMFETTITLKPESEWRPGMTYEQLIVQMDSLVRTPGVINAWTMPIKGRIDMLATGIRTPVGIKIFGPDLTVLEQLGKKMEAVIQSVPGTRSVFAERANSGYYVDIDINRTAAARYGLNVADVQTVIATAIGGMVLTQTVEGRERYGVRIRYPQELRDSPEKLASVLVPVNLGAAAAGGMPDGPAGAPAGSSRVTQVPLGQLATIRTQPGPMVVRTEGATPTAWVYVDVVGRDIGSYVTEAQERVRAAVVFPPGYSMVWSGQYEYMQRARATMMLVIPATLTLIFLLLFFNFRSVGETVIVMLSLPFALIGGFWFIYLLGYNWSVAVAIGFVALSGVATETGVVMLIYLDLAVKAVQARAAVEHRQMTLRDLYDAVMHGAVERVRPKMMTVTAIMAGLLPILWGHGTGSSVMKRIAAPMVGGMISSSILTLIVIPAVYSLWMQRVVMRQTGGALPAPAGSATVRDGQPVPVAAVPDGLIAG